MSKPKSMTFPGPFIFSLFFTLLLVSCGNDSSGNGDSLSGSTIVKASPDSAPSFAITVKTFVVNDSTRKKTGWGYDLYIDGKRTIHQPLIPAVPGTDAFVTEEDAKKTGELAIKKMKQTGTFPTITIHDLDSLGIKHQ